MIRDECLSYENRLRELRLSSLEKKRLWRRKGSGETPSSA